MRLLLPKCNAVHVAKRQLAYGDVVKNIPKDCLEIEIDHEGEVKIYDLDASGFKIAEVMPKLCEACPACPEEEPCEEEVPSLMDLDLETPIVNQPLVEEDDEPEYEAPEDDPPMEIEDDADGEQI